MAVAKIKIGQLDRQVEFRNPTKTVQPSGGTRSTFEKWMTTWAHMAPISGYRNMSEGFAYNIVRYDMWCRWRQAMADDLQKETLVVYNDKIFTIDSAIIEDDIKRTQKFYHFTITEKR